MGWEKRGAQRYYYRKQREGRRVVSRYIGRGEVAEAIAQFDRNAVARRRLAGDEERKEREAERTIDRQVDAVCDEARLLVAKALLANGYHTHRGQWRRRRNGQN